MKLFFQIVWESIKNFREDDCITLSGAISFVFLLSIIPLMTLAAKFFQVVQKNFFSGIAINQTEIFLQELNRVIPFVSPQWLKSNIFNSSGGSSLTLFSILMLPMVSGIIFHELETAYKKIFKIPRKLKVIRQFFYAFFTILFLIFIFIANFLWVIISSILSNFASFFEYSSFLYGKLSFFTGSKLLIVEFISIFFLAGFFILTSKIFLPTYLNIKIKNRIIPAFTFAFLWITARSVFSFYLKHMSIVNIIYGSVSSVVIILLWIFYSAITLLFSVEVMFTLTKKAENDKLISGFKYR